MSIFFTVKVSLRVKVKRKNAVILCLCMVSSQTGLLQGFNRDLTIPRRRRQQDRLKACLHGGGGPQIGEVTFGGSPHLSCEHDRIKMRDYMDRRVTPPKRDTSPSWGPPPPCKQALKQNSFYEQNNNSARASQFLYIPLPSLPNYDVK